MALIQCLECGNRISDKATTCPHCGCPLSEQLSTGIVRIKIPALKIEGWASLFASRDAEIIEKHTNKTLWTGRQGENASISLDGPTEIVITLGNFANDVCGTVFPRKKYTLVEDMGIHWKATYTITEVDVIDSE